MRWICPGTVKPPSASFLTGFRVLAPKVSVLLPTHNRADVLGYAIRSVLSQSMPDLELLIVGDGCTDGTRDVVAQFDDPRITWFDLPKAPLSGYANRNVVLRQAKGFFVAYAQHDDLWFPDHLELLLGTIVRADAEWAYSRPVWIGPDGTACPSAVDLTVDEQLTRFMEVENDIPSSCVIHLRSALDRVGYWPEDRPVLADWVCWHRIISTAVRPGVGYCPMPTNLHFRAAWRDFDSSMERAWRPLAQMPGWPPVLACPPAGEPEQAVFWRAMTGQPDWASRFRDATRTVLDRMAWTAIRDLLPVIEREAALASAAQAESHRATLLQQANDAALTRLTVAEAERGAALACVSELQQALDAAVTKLAQAGAEREAALAAAQASDRERAALRAIADSRIWRATGPLRDAVDAVKRVI